MALPSDVKVKRWDHVDMEKRRKALALGGSQRDARLGDRATFAKELRAKAEATWERKFGGKNPSDVVREAAKARTATFVRSQGELDEFEEYLKKDDTPKWGRVIEMDNMSRHEWPVCRELGLAYRTNYRDLDGKTEGQDSVTSQIRMRAREEQQKLAAEAEKARKEKEERDKANQKLTCPTCHKPFSKIMMTRHGCPPPAQATV